MVHPAKQAAQEFAYLSEKLRKELGEEDLADTVDGLVDFDEKIIAIDTQLRENAMILEGVEKEIERLKKRKERLGHSIENLKGLILYCLRTSGKHMVKYPLGTIHTHKIPPKLVVDDEQTVIADGPEDCIEYKMVIKRSRIKERLEAGEVVPGAHIEQGSIGLTIRRS